jgi:hypothetical protein
MSLKITDSLGDGINQLGWVKESYYYDSMMSFRHTDYTIDENGFWIEMNLSGNLNMTPAVDCKIIEHGNYGGILFNGYLETKEDLINVMNLLYIFRDDKVVQKYLT